MKRVLCVGRISAPDEGTITPPGVMVREIKVQADLGFDSPLYSKIFFDARELELTSEALGMTFQAIDRAGSNRSIG
jgi:hypothetical protein